MKNFLTSMLLCLLLSALAGCATTSKDNTTVTDNSPTIVGNVTGGSETANVTPTPVPPTPTPEGNYVGFSLDSGFYEKSQTVSLTCNIEGAEIYYTLDGSTPTKDSNLYRGEITVSRKLYTENVLAAQENISAGNPYIPGYAVDKGTVIRAIAYLPDGTTTPVAHATYFIGLDRAKYGNVPIVSLITDFDHLYDYETGIYVLGKTHDEWLAENPANGSLEGWQHVGNYSNRGRQWERPVSVELITADGTHGFKQNMGVRIMGGASRNQAQKSLKLYAREEYEAKNLKYELIPNNYNTDGELIDKYKTFVLRVGGNDADFGRLRDPFIQSLVQDGRFETQQNTPCVVFINGEYWGMYTITEDYTDNHFENNYGIDNNNIVLVKRGELEEGEESDLALYHELYHFITQNDMSDSKNYKKASDMLDMGSFADYCALNQYIYNKDNLCEDNNWRMWRVRNADGATEWSDGKWRMAVYDTDFSTGIYDGSDSANTDNISSWLAAASDEEYQQNLANYAPIELFRSLIQNDEFKEEYLLALCDMRNIYFEPKTAKRVLDEMSVTYSALMPDSFRRFGPDWIAANPEGHYDGQLKQLSGFLTNRYVALPNMMNKIFDLDSSVKLSVNTNDKTMGTVYVNGRELDLSFDYAGIYYPGLTVTVTAVPAEGCQFVGWTVKKGELADSSSETLIFDMTGTTSLQAIFEAE